MRRLGAQAARAALLVGALSLMSCARDPVGVLKLSGVPAAAARLEVWTWQGGVAATEPLRFPIDAPRDPQSLGLRLGPMQTAPLQIGIGAFDGAGCLVALGEAAATPTGGDFGLRATLTPVGGPCDAARPLIVSVSPGSARTTARETLTVTALGLRPGMAVRVGADAAPDVVVQSPTRAAGSLPALPGRAGRKDVAVDATVARGALQLVLGALSFQFVPFPAPGAPTYLLESRGGLATLPGTAGRTDLVAIGPGYRVGRATPPPAVLLHSVASDRIDFVQYGFPALPGAPLYVAAADLNGDGVRDEVLISACDPGSGAPCAVGGNGYVAAYRISGTTITPLGSILTLSKRGQRFDNTNHGAVVPAGADGRQSVILVWTSPSGAAYAGYQYRLTDKDQLEEVLLGTDPEVDLVGWGFPLLVGSFTKATGPEVVTGHEGPQVIQYAPMLATKTLAYQATSPRLDSPRWIASGDVDGDGRPDLVAPRFRLGGAVVYRNTTPAALTTELRLSDGDVLPCGTASFAVAAADLDGDGRAEVICGDLMDRADAPNGKQDGVEVYTLIPDVANQWGRFQAVPLSLPTSTTAGGGTRTVTTGDFNGDGLVDIAVAASISSSLVFLWNRTQ